tara:strand:- start:4439 stop:4762 length:324 start_codon:yes stop_codon:yes gene_type:complete
MKKSDVIERIYNVIVEKKGADPKISYVSYLRNKGLNKIAEKLGEEATETIVAAVTSKRNQTISESADLIFVLMVLLAEMKIFPEEVFEELIKREGTSGHVEKLQRNE